MFPFKKKPELPKQPARDPAHEDLRKRLVETDTRLGKVVEEMKRRIAERQHQTELAK